MRLRTVLFDKVTKSVNCFLSEIKDYPPLKVEEEVELGRIITSSNNEEEVMKAREKLCLHNTLFVVSVAKQYLGLGLPIEDLISEGLYGLWRATEKWDYTKGVKFCSYAVWWIRRYIVNLLYEHASLVTLPISTVRKIREYKNTLEESEEDSTFVPFINLDTKGYRVNVLSLEGPASVGSERRMIEYISGGINQEDKENSEILNRLLSSLTEKERYVICRRIGLDGWEPASFEAIGKELKVSPNLVSRMYTVILQKLKKIIDPETKRDLLE